MATDRCPGRKPCFASCRSYAHGIWNCPVGPATGRRHHSENSAILYTNADGDVVSVDLVDGHQSGKWDIPKPIEMISHDVSDIHGQASLPLRADMPALEVARRIAVAKAIHSPVSMEACCIKKRESLAAKGVAA